MDKISFNGKDYPCISIDLDNENFKGTCTISTESLKYRLFNEDGSYVSDQAKAVDEGIFFYAPDKLIDKNEELIRDFVNDSLQGIPVERKKLMAFEIKDNLYEVYGSYELGQESNITAPKNVDFILQNGKKMTSFGETWAGAVLDEHDFTAMAVAAYVNDDTSVRFAEVCDALRAYKDSMQTYSHELDGRNVPDFILTPHGEVGTLMALSETGGYYFKRKK